VDNFNQINHPAAAHYQSARLKTYASIQSAADWFTDKIQIEIRARDPLLRL
jgi:hypothetical protein